MWGGVGSAWLAMGAWEKDSRGGGGGGHVLGRKGLW